MTPSDYITQHRVNLTWEWYCFSRRHSGDYPLAQDCLDWLNQHPQRAEIDQIITEWSQGPDDNLCIESYLFELFDSQRS